MRTPHIRHEPHAGRHRVICDECGPVRVVPTVVDARAVARNHADGHRGGVGR